MPHVEAEPRRLQLLSPEDGATVPAGSLVRLAVASFDPNALVSWTSDRDGPLGEGPEIPVWNLTPGRHRIEARTATAFELPVSFKVRVTSKRRRKDAP